MPNYKLTYFKIRGRAETARYIFAYSGINYEDNTVDIMDWPDVKQSLLFRQIPILKVDKTEINQSTAIARYLARETGLAGKTNLEQAQVDAIVDTINDFMNMFPWTEKDPSVKVTWADFHWAVCSITLTNLNVDVLHNYPKLLALKERVEALPKIAAWIERRPKTPL
ncbi:hematopoietic prostaglandin D synthase-like isoform X2 [Chiloscyllium plagiosum]|uniref:hematopoietic prostaglandin D synthase-like isoform X2 n=1 Tax=Chiloscyllium plagiosum TaxID=36176 RepID=UPI001CB84824|nr:hematopoietic prostaglandin D synthase-like isoform X2 [Chiloscyllium plagiosum]